MTLNFSHLCTFPQETVNPGPIQWPQEGLNIDIKKKKKVFYNATKCDVNLQASSDSVNYNLLKQ